MIEYFARFWAFGHTFSLLFSLNMFQLCELSGSDSESVKMISDKLKKIRLSKHDHVKQILTANVDVTHRMSKWKQGTLFVYHYFNCLSMLVFSLTQNIIVESFDELLLFLYDNRDV